MHEPPLVMTHATLQGLLVILKGNSLRRQNHLEHAKGTYETHSKTA